MNLYRGLIDGNFPLGGFFAPWIIVFVLVELVLKGFSLYRAARNEDKYWFIAILVLNTIGILPAIYLLFFSKRGKKK